MKRFRGFTLIELMVVIAIVAILATIAVPAFTDQVRKSRRSEAMQALSDLQLREERWRASNSTYTVSLTDLGVTVATLPSGYYSMSLSTPTSTTTGCTCTTNNCFAVTATSAGAQLSDARCTTMVVANNCGTVKKTSTPAGNKCW